MQQWDYDYMQLKGKWDDIVDSLCEKGTQGWELVTIVTQVSKQGTEKVAIFKRPFAPETVIEL